MCPVLFVTLSFAKGLALKNHRAGFFVRKLTQNDNIGIWNQQVVHTTTH